MAGLTLWLIYLFVKRQAKPTWKVMGWLILALLFTYMAIDDGAQIHERVGTAIKRGAGSSLNFFPSYTWHLVFVPVFGALGLFALVFLWQELQQRHARMLVITAICLFVIAVGMDFVEGLDRYHPWNIYTWISERNDLESWTARRFGKSAYDTLRHFSRSIEETIEMLAITILWFLFLRHLAVVAGNLRVRFK
jgi:hypothetical protein